VQLKHVISVGCVIPDSWWSKADQVFLQMPLTSLEIITAFTNGSPLLIPITFRLC